MTAASRLTATVVDVAVGPCVRGAGSSLSLHERPRAQRTFATPDEAVRALTEAAKSSNLDDLLAIFGRDGKELIASSDPATARRNREVFTVAVAEGWRWIDQGTNRKTLIVGNEALAVSGSAREEREPAGDSTRRGQGRSARAPDRPQRAGRDRDLPDLRRGTAASTRDRDTTESPRACSRRPSAAIRASTTGCTGRRRTVSQRSPLGDLVAQAAEEGRTILSDRVTAHAVSRLLLQDPDGAGSRRAGRRQVLHRQRRDVGRVRARRVAGAVRRQRRHDVRRQPGRRGSRNGPGSGNSSHGRRDHHLQSRRVLAPGPLDAHVSARTKRSQSYRDHEDTKTRRYTKKNVLDKTGLLRASSCSSCFRGQDSAGCRLCRNQSSMTTRLTNAGTRSS